MTEASKYVFDNFHIRKTKKQKDGFIDHILQFAKDSGYSAKVEKGSFGARNIVIGDPASAKAVYTAHYDTCPRLPFPNFITPKNFFYYLVYQLLITAVLLAVLFVVAFGLAYVADLICDALAIGEDLAGLLSYYAWLLGYFLAFFRHGRYAAVQLLQQTLYVLQKDFSLFVQKQLPVFAVEQRAAQLFFQT